MKILKVNEATKKKTSSMKSFSECWYQIATQILWKIKSIVRWMNHKMGDILTVTSFRINRNVWSWINSNHSTKMFYHCDVQWICYCMSSPIQLCIHSFVHLMLKNYRIFIEQLTEMCFCSYNPFHCKSSMIWFV